MNIPTRLLTVASALTLAIVLLFSAPLIAGEVKDMTKEELLERMSDHDLIILDVRRGYDWDASEFKIKGAIRVEDLDAFAANQAKDAEIVLYCA